MLQLALNANYTMDELHDLFEAKLYKAVFGPWVSQVDYRINGAHLTNQTF